MFLSEKQIQAKQKAIESQERKQRIDNAIATFQMAPGYLDIMDMLQEMIDNKKAAMQVSIGNADLFSNYAAQMLGVEEVFDKLSKK